MKKCYQFLLPLIIYSSFLTGCSSKFNSKEICLNTDNMKEAEDGIINSQQGNAVIDAYICEKKNLKNDTIPWADVFVCKFYNNTSVADTVILIDTQLRKVEPERDYDIYWIELEPTQKLKKCKVLIPRSQADYIRKHKYRYASVTLVTDD